MKGYDTSVMKGLDIKFARSDFWHWYSSFFAKFQNAYIRKLFGMAKVAYLS